MSKVTMPEPFMYGIMDPDGTPYFGELCVSGNKGDLDDDIYDLNGGNEAGPYQEVALITTAQAEAYAAAKVREAQQWQPIETAPKDGTAILIGNERGAWIAKYEPVHPSGYRPANPWFSLMLNHNHMRKGKPFGPTHWMPLPAPPLPGPVEPQSTTAQNQQSAQSA